MYSRILFAVDDDEALPAAVPVVAACARRCGADVRVLHVLRTGPDAPNGTSRRLVKSVVEQLWSRGVRADGEVRPVRGREQVAAMIARTARGAEADLVAIGSHGRSDLGAIFLGSVSDAVAGGLETPVLVVRAASDAPAEPRTVLVAVDGSAASDEAVEEAAELAERFSASAVVVHVRQVMTVQEATFTESEEEAQAIVRRGVAAMERRGVRATGVVSLASSVPSELAAAAERVGADLVVLGSRRPSHVSGLLLGSVGHELVHRLRRPVLLARRVRSAEPVG
jgi:nucleotide-binding universal stress UspA family protein